MAFPFPFPSLSSSFTSNFTVSEEEFNLFHSMDRKLFTRLVVNLGRDPAESMQVMALWLWFERVGYCRALIDKMLPLPLTLINSLADEAVMCLNCIEQDEFPSRFDNLEIALTQTLAHSEMISLRFFYAIRVAAIRGVTQIVNEVCSRAFQDILRRVLENNQNQEHDVDNVVGGRQEPIVFGPIVGFPAFGNPSIGFVPYVRSGTAGRRIWNIPQIVSNNAGVGPMDSRAIMEGVASACEISRAFDQYDLGYQREVLSNELSGLLGNITLTNNEEEEEERELVPADDRTIFLTFSKGYPTTEIEVIDFFTSRYGDCIDAIFMQEVPRDEQVLYARLVVKSASTIDVVLEGQSRVKFSINGKHVWGRKYVRKQPSAAQGATTSSSLTPSQPPSLRGDIKA